MIKKLSIAILVLLFASTGFTQDKSFYKTWGVSPVGLVTKWQRSDPRAGTSLAIEYDSTGNGVHIAQPVADNQVSIVGSVNLAGLVDKFGGINDFWVQEKLADESTLTLLPDGPFMNLLDGSAAIQIPASVFTECVKASGPCVVNVFDSAGALIAGPGYPRVQDSALAFGAELALTSNCTDPLDDQNNTNGWVPRSGTTLSSEAGGVTGFKLKVLSDGATLRFASFTKTVVAGTLFNIKAELGAETGGDIYRLQIADGSGILYDSGDVAGQGAGVWDTYDVYVVAIATDLTVRVQAVGGGDIAYADNVSLKEVTNLGETAALIWDTPDGSGNQNWTGTGSGDPNDPLATLAVRKSDLNFTGDITIGILFKPDDGQSGTTEYLIAKYDSPLDQRAVYVSLRLDGKIQVSVSSGGAVETGNEETNSAVFTDGAQDEFTFLTIVITVGDSIKIYKNGVLVPSTMTGSMPASLHDSAVPWLIGVTQPSNPIAFYAGQIADLPIWGRALSAAEVQNYWLSKGMRKLIGGL